MDGSIDMNSKKKIISLIKKYKKIKKIGALYSIPIGYKYIIVITVYIDGKMITNKSHEIVDNLEKDIIREIDKVEEVLIHVEPFVKNHRAN